MNTEKIKTINKQIITCIVLINAILIIKKIVATNFIAIINNVLCLLTLLVPPLLNKMTKIKISELFKLLYYIYIILTILIGIELSLIKNTLWYDKIIHFYFGLLAAIFGFFLLKYKNINLKQNLWFNILFIMSFVLLLATCWEFLEYFLDKLLTMNNQRTKQTGVNDTMLDLLVAFLGSILISFSYFIEQKKHGIIFSIIQTKNKKSKDSKQRQTKKYYPQ